MRLAHGPNHLGPILCGSKRCFVTFWCKKPDILAKGIIERMLYVHFLRGRSLEVMKPNFPQELLLEEFVAAIAKWWQGGCWSATYSSA